MAPKQNQRFTARELTSNSNNPAIRSLYDQVLLHTYQDQQKILEKAKKIEKK